MTTTRARLLIGICAVAGSVVAGHAGQDQPPRSTFRTEANYVRVDVFPTRDGQPVPDLRQDEFEVLDNGVPQKIEQFERVVIRGNVPQALRREPTSLAESRAMLEAPRARVFVLFLDTSHVGLASSRTIQKPLVDTLDNLIGVDDLVGVMTPDMSAGDVTFARKTISLQGMLERWWGDRDRLASKDLVEEQYKLCYPPAPGEPFVSPLAQEMINRRREQMTLDALEELVTFVRGVREERKAILVVTEGWRLFGRNDALTNDTSNGVPGLPPIGVDPATGKLSTRSSSDPRVTQLDCDRDRMTLSQSDHEQQFLRLLDEANRSNASFYPVDPRGLPVFDSPIGPDRPPPIRVDAAMLRARQTSLRTLAESTDGLALVNTNQIAAGLKRIVADLSSYYLLGYYASDVKMDGRFHKITVRVKRPGVQVRARRGYLATTEAEVSRSTNMSGASADDAPTAEARAIETALGSLGGLSRELPLRTQVAAGWNATSHAAMVWAVGELGMGPDWKSGGEADVALTSAWGSSIATVRARVEPGTRTFRVTLTPTSPIEPGEYIVRVRVRGVASETIPATDLVRVRLPRPPEATGAMFLRRGTSTGNKEVATADLRFRRSEQLRVEVPVSQSDMPTARLLDRTGQPLAIPVTAALRDEADGSRWLTANLALAPLAAGDYLIELSGGGGRTRVAFRVVP